jgi:hypothetical protein
MIKASEVDYVHGVRESARNMAEDNFVDELDMPPRAYFDIPQNIPTAELQLQRIVAYVMVSGPCNQENAEKFRDESTEKVRSELRKLGGGIIWWRTRFEIDQSDRRNKIWRAYGRCGTSPALPESFWSQLAQSFWSQFDQRIK